jgi:hypothetical protein
VAALTKTGVGLTGDPAHIPNTSATTRTRTFTYLPFFGAGGGGAGASEFQISRM